jgi:hypothetical protein
MMPVQVNSEVDEEDATLKEARALVAKHKALCTRKLEEVRGGQQGGDGGRLPSAKELYMIWYMASTIGGGLTSRVLSSRIGRECQHPQYQQQYSVCTSNGYRVHAT